MLFFVEENENPIYTLRNQRNHKIISWATRSPSIYPQESFLNLEHWQIYRNDTYRFTMLLPPSWYLVVARPDTVLRLFNSNQDYFREGSLIDPIQIHLSQNIENWGVEELLNSDNGLLNTDGYYTRRVRVTLFGGKEVVMLVGNYLSPSDSYEILSSKVIMRLTLRAGGEAERVILKNIIYSVTFY